MFGRGFGARGGLFARCTKMKGGPEGGSYDRPGSWPSHLSCRKASGALGWAVRLINAGRAVRCFNTYWLILVMICTLIDTIHELRIVFKNMVISVRQTWQ